MRLPLRIFSDLHLGHSASRIRKVEMLRPLFRGAGTVLFNGDTWEELSPIWRETSAKMLSELQTLLAEEGCDAIFLPGNHDPSWPEKSLWQLAEGKIALTHGDALLRSGAPWKREVLAQPELIEELWQQFPHAEKNLDARLELARAIALRLPTLHPPKTRTLAGRVLDAVFPPRRPLEMLTSWLRQSHYGALFCETYLPNAKLLVNGHFHRYGAKKVRGKIVINTGSFVIPGRAGWVEWDGDRLIFGKVHEKKSEFLLDPAAKIYASR